MKEKALASQRKLATQLVDKLDGAIRPLQTSIASRKWSHLPDLVRDPIEKALKLFQDALENAEKAQSSDDIVDLPDAKAP